MNFAKHINGMSDDSFIIEYIRNKKKGVTVTEKRHLIKNVMVDGREVYYVHFEYLLVKEKTFFWNTDTVVSRTVKDVIPFRKDDADYYIKNAVCPSTKRNSYIYMHMKREIYLKPFDGNEKLNVYAQQEYKDSDLYFNIHVKHYSTIDSDTENTLSGTDRYIRNYFRNQYPVSSDVIETIEMNGLCNITETDKDRIKENIEKTKGPLKAIIVDEIGRTENYLMLLKKLL